MGHAPKRVFLGWERACLESACAFLAGQYRDGRRVDLTGPLVVVPGGRARRALLAMLVEACDEQGLMLLPPTMVTPGEVGDALAAPPAGRRVGAPLVRRLAWIQALRGASAETLGRLVRQPPADEDIVRWSALAGMLEGRHAELAGELLLFEDVPERASSIPDFPDEERWHAAGEIQRAYEATLERWGLFDPLLERMRVARDAGAVPRQELVLIGVSELNRATRAIIERNEGEVVALVFAPEGHEGRFDELGCVRAEAWGEADVELDDDRILIAEGPDDQADAAFEALAALGAEYATDEIVIGVPDRSVVAYLRQRAGRYGGVEVRYAGGVTVGRTPVYRLLSAMADYLESGSFDAIASIVRHPDVETILERRLGRPGRHAWWIDEIDQYRGEHVQQRADGQWLGNRPERLGGVRGAYRIVSELMEPLHPDRVGARAPREAIDRWARAALDVLGRVYGGVERNRLGEDRITIEACFELRAGVEGLVRQMAGRDEMRATPAQAIRLLLEQVRDTDIPERPNDETIELLGWLELAMDPAPVAIVTGMNEGAVPSTIVGDAMLPDGLRRVLGLADDRRRLARDTYLLSSIVASRAHTCFVSGRRNPEGDPLKPSRLLLRCDERTAGARLARLTADHFDERRRVRLVTHLSPGARSLFLPGRVVSYTPIDSMRVTSFKTYLASPYEFYLRHVMRADEREDEPREMGPAPFGSLIHVVLDAFGRGDARDSDDPRRVEQSIMDQLETVARGQFGTTPRASVAIQIELVRLRLMEFAQRQAERVRAGWRIVVTEWRPDEKRAPFEVDGEVMWLRGMIDRIDRHEDGRLAIIDYKTGENASKPESAHRGRDGWRDLQLPLYRHLARELGVSDEVELAYGALPRDEHGVAFLTAKWGEEDLRDADEAARGVVRSIRAGLFEEIGDPYRGDGAVSRLCGFGLIGGGLDDAGGAS